MAHESFEDIEVSQLLNKKFISVKVDKEERPDIDSIYMQCCQAITGSGGWPLTIIMTPDKKPFYAGTYLPKHSRFKVTGLIELLTEISYKWEKDKGYMENIAHEIVRFVKDGSEQEQPGKANIKPEELVNKAFNYFRNSFDSVYGGFSRAPKFPMAHNLLFLLDYYKLIDEQDALYMAEKTLEQMYRGGIFDHIGFGFSRYSTDEKWLAPHFEKMLYDNALLILAYTKAYDVTGKELYKNIAKKTIGYIFRELTGKNGEFYCAQDADSDGVEGKYYIFEPQEILKIIGKEKGTEFNINFDISEEGNFEGKNIPNLIKSNINTEMDDCCNRIYEYRKLRASLHKDDKVLTAWNGLMIAALSEAYAVFREDEYLKAAEKAAGFINDNLCQGDRLYASYRDGRRSEQGFIDDYAFYIFGLIKLYMVSFNQQHLNKAITLSYRAAEDFSDGSGGFFLYGNESEKLFYRPKETYDGAMPSGNSIMAYNFVMLLRLTKKEEFEKLCETQIHFMLAESERHPSVYSFFMYTLLQYLFPPNEVICVLKDKKDYVKVINTFPKDCIITILENPTLEYPLLNDRTTYYVCTHNMCMAPTNEI